MTWEISARAAEIPEIAGVLGADDVVASACSIARVQTREGMIPWFPGGHCDPWNHTEAAMALATCGLYDEARLAFDWLEANQLSDGSWFRYHTNNAVEDARLDTNVCAYVATGLWHHALVTGSSDVLVRYWPMVERAIDFVLRWQRLDGAIVWSLDQAGRPERYALLTGSSSVLHSLRCAVAIGEALERPRPDWELAAGHLAHAISHHETAFEPKADFAMDWYYPVLCGVVAGGRARRRLEAGWETFVLAGRGVRCVAESEWVTAAETAECVIALSAAGMHGHASELLAGIQALRHGDGSYSTGVVYPQAVTYPNAERTTYSAAAMVLAADALSGATNAARLFLGDPLPRVIELPGPCCAG